MFAQGEPGSPKWTAGCGELWGPNTLEATEATAQRTAKPRGASPCSSLKGAGQTAPHVNRDHAIAMMMAVTTNSAYVALNRHYARCFICLISSDLATACQGGVILMLQMKQLRLREAKALARSYKEHWNWNSNSEKLDPRVHRVGSVYVDKSFYRLAPSMWTFCSDEIVL